MYVGHDAIEHPQLKAMLQRIRGEPFFNETKILVGGSVFNDEKVREALEPGPNRSGTADFLALTFSAALEFSRSLSKTRTVDLQRNAPRNGLIYWRIQ